MPCALLLTLNYRVFCIFFVIERKFCSILSVFVATKHLLVLNGSTTCFIFHLTKMHFYKHFCFTLIFNALVSKHIHEENIKSIVRATYLMFVLFVSNIKCLRITKTKYTNKNQKKIQLSSLCNNQISAHLYLRYEETK